jgi:broad specificity phosphatase PhoE
MIPREAGMAPKQIIVIRHAQKPSAKPHRRGVREDGTNDHESLTVQGWQHAGSLAAIFAGPGPLEHGLNRPDVIFAADIGKKRVKGAGGKKVTVGSHSRRPLQTVAAMAERVGLTPVTSYTKGEEAELVQDVLGRNDSVLICWQHEDIPTIGNRIIGDATTVPQAWPENRYDLIWIFDRTTKGWRFTELSQARLDTNAAARGRSRLPRRSRLPGPPHAIR